MRALPLSIGTIHFVGIGGIGMSGIAEVLHNLGYSVQGSDIVDSANVRRLREAGIPVAIGHDQAHLGRAQVVVVSAAVKRDNPEVAAARARLIPVVRRAAALLSGMENGAADLPLFAAAPISEADAVPHDAVGAHRAVPDALLTELLALDPDKLTPREALDAVYRLRALLTETRPALG